MAANRHGAGCAVLACQAASPVPVPRQHLPGARDPLAVGRPQPYRRHRIHFGEARMQRDWPDLLQLGACLGPRCRPGIWDVGKPLGQRGEIEPAAAGEDRQPARFPRRCHGRKCRLAPPGDVAGLRRRPDAVQGVRDTCFIVWRWTRGEHTQLAVHLHGVGVDDRAVEALGQRECQGGFAACGRAGNDQRLHLRHENRPSRLNGRQYAAMGNSESNLTRRRR